MKLIILFVAAFSLAACSDEQGATRALDNAGFSDIQITGMGWFGCSDNDFYNTKFVAKNPRGKIVTGNVCSNGWLGKGSTIRFD